MTGHIARTISKRNRQTTAKCSTVDKGGVPMSLGMVYAAALHGMEVKFICVEADLSNGLPMFQRVGYL